ncbi:MAG: tetratricopeptide repeat protein [Methanobrevibacter sp.]|nr:tetratricopeptide repeat protein [Methanobrevibacter sp.]
MKFCYECGYKLEGYEKVCPECGTELKRPEDTEFFVESIFNQLAEDLDQIKNNALDMLDEMDIEDAIDDFSINSKKALNRDADYINRARKKLNNSGEEERVIYLCKKALLIDDLNWEAYYLKGRALINLKRYDEAINDLINSLALNDDNIDARLYIAKAAHLNGDFNYALQVYDSVLNIDEKSFEALNGKALVYFDKKDFLEADKFFKKACKISVLPEDSKIKWNFAAAKLKEE